MTRAFRHGNHAVFIADARGEQHHLPHGHVKERGEEICSINLMTLEPLQPNKKIPRGLLPLLEEHQDEMLRIWEELNQP